MEQNFRRHSSASVWLATIVVVAVGGDECEVAVEARESERRCARSDVGDCFFVFMRPRIVETRRESGVVACCNCGRACRDVGAYERVDVEHGGERVNAENECAFGVETENEKKKLSSRRPFHVAAHDRRGDY